MAGHRGGSQAGRRYALLLRGVNLGRNRRLAMADLRACLQDLGCGDVATYLNSGNAAVTASAQPKRLAAQVEAALAERCGIGTRVLVRSHAQLAALVAANPFPDAVAEPAKLHVAFLSAAPDAGAASALDPAALAPDEFALGEDAVYLRYAWGPVAAGWPMSCCGRSPGGARASSPRTGTGTPCSP